VAQPIGREQPAEVLLAADGAFYQFLLPQGLLNGLQIHNSPLRPPRTWQHEPDP
jgi:hypothetical protein